MVWTLQNIEHFPQAELEQIHNTTLWVSHSLRPNNIYAFAPVEGFKHSWEMEPPWRDGGHSISLHLSHQALFSLHRHQLPECAGAPFQFIFRDEKVLQHWFCLPCIAHFFIHSLLVDGGLACHHGNGCSKHTPWRVVAKSCLRTRFQSLTRSKNFWAPSSFSKQQGGEEGVAES